MRSQLGPVLPTGWRMEPGQPGMTLGTRRMLSSTPEQSPPKKQIGTEVIAGFPSCCKLFKGPTCCEHPSSLGQIPNPAASGPCLARILGWLLRLSHLALMHVGCTGRLQVNSSRILKGTPRRKTCPAS